MRGRSGRGPSLARAAPPAPTRPLWVWGHDDPQAVVDFAVQHSVDELYVHVSPTVLTDGELPRLTRLSQLAQPAGLRLLALERALGAVDGAAADHPTYAGTVVHDFTGWAALGP